MWGTALLAALACGPSAPPTTIRAGLLLDGQGGQTRDALITITNGRITAVGPYASGPVTHDLSSYTVLPGLIDAHVHISGYINRLGRVSSSGDGESPAQRAAGFAVSALATLRAGFTTVASMGSDDDRELRDSIERGGTPGPRILTSLSPITDTSLSLRGMRRLIRQKRGSGADFIKIIGSTTVRDGGGPNFSLEKLTALCRETRRQGLRSVVHAQSDRSLQVAAEAGCDQVEHGFLATAEGLRVLADRGIAFDPQCELVLSNYLENRARLEGVQGFDPPVFELMKELRPVLPNVLRLAQATDGLRLLYGTDATTGAHGRNADDLVCRVRFAGQQPMAVLVTATSGNAASLGLGREIGTIAPGFQADLIALDGNPLEQIEAVRRVKFVMRKGTVFLAP